MTEAPMTKQLLALAPPVLALLVLALLPRLAATQPPAEPPEAEQLPVDRPADEVTLELRRGQRPLIRLAMPAFRLAGVSGETAEAARELEATVRADLEASGYFQIQGPRDFAVLQVTGDPARDAAQYRSLGNEILLAGDVRAEGERIVFEGRLWDLQSGQAILAKRYRGGLPVARRIGHTFADEVIRYLTGGRGIGLTSIAFTSDRTGHKEIWIMDYDGAGQRRLTGHKSTSMSPSWEASGAGLAYTSFFNGPPGIYYVDLATGRKRSIVNTGSLNISPTFSPDGGRVAFARSLGGNIEIFTADRNGDGATRLTHSNAIDATPAWSPKGGQIVFTSSRAGNPHIYLTSTDGADQRRLTFDGDYNDGAAWSPEGDRIAYTSRRGGRFQIAVLDLTTLESRVLTSGGGENESPTFSPDGRKIAFTSRRTGRKQIYVMDAVTGADVRPLTREGNNDMAEWSRN